MACLVMGDERSRDLIERKETDLNEKSEIHRKVQQYIGRRYEIYLTDGRIIRGTMLATDRDANMVFNQADERWNEITTSGVRYLGQAMISKKYVVKMIVLPEPSNIKIESCKVEQVKADNIETGGVETEKKDEEDLEAKKVE